MDPGEDLVDGHHDDDGQGKAEVAEEPPNLSKGGHAVVFWSTSLPLASAK